MALNYSKKKQDSQSGADIDLDSPDSHQVVNKKEIENPLAWQSQIWYWRTHLDVFIQDYYSSPDSKVNLHDFQEVIARQCGNCSSVKDVESRSLGKTWKMAWILAAICTLYSSTPVLVVSKTQTQACLTLQYLRTFASKYPNLQRELASPVRITKAGGYVEFKNGSSISALAMSTDGSNLRGLRKKVILIDEASWVNSEVITSVLMPILSFKRDIWWEKHEEGFEDFESKLFETSSAYLKSCDFFSRFTKTLTSMRGSKETPPDTNIFASALNYEVAIRTGAKTRQEIETYRNSMPASSFDTEWGSKFLGSENGSFLPYDLTEPCRDLPRVELCQPKGSKSRYILSLDVATSDAKTADNAALTIVKISERTTSAGKLDGTYNKYLVYIRTFHGYGQEALALEVRKMCVRFPNIEKVIIDFNAIGEGVSALLNFPYVDDENKEHKPLIPDDTGYAGSNAIPIVRCFRGNNKLNGRMATKLKLYFENKSLHLPVQSSNISREEEAGNTIEFDEDVGKKPRVRTELIEEVGVYKETDALQYECGCIVPKITASGNTIYESALTTQKKDRYSSLGMAMEYVSQLEDENREKYNNNNGNQCWGMATTF